MAGAEAVLAVPEIRDYAQINKEIARRLDEGATRVVLAGVEGQRLLAAGLRGNWSATIEVDGRAGPELAAGLAAPDLTVICRGSAADAAGRGLVAGRLVIVGSAGDGLGYAQRGGTIVVRGDAGHRAGLMQSGGTLIVLGSAGRLAGEQQSGGRFFVDKDRLGHHPGRGHTGGVMVSVGPDPSASDEDRAVLEAVLADLP